MARHPCRAKRRRTFEVHVHVKSQTRQHKAQHMGDRGPRPTACHMHPKTEPEQCRLQIKAFKNLIDTINEAGGQAGATPHSIDLVCQEQGLKIHLHTAGLTMDCRVGLHWHFHCYCLISKPRPVLDFSSKKSMFVF